MHSSISTHDASLHQHKVCLSLVDTIVQLTLIAVLDIVMLLIPALNYLDGFAISSLQRHSLLDYQNNIALLTDYYLYNTALI